MKTVVGLYKTMSEANSVKSQLSGKGYTADRITVIDQSKDSYSAGSGSTGSTDDSVGGKIKHFFSGLTGSDDTAHESYTQGVSGGGALLAVTVPDEQAESTADMLFEYGASDIEGGRGNYGSGYGSTTGATGAEDVAVLEGSTDRSTGMTGYNQTAVTTPAIGGQVIPIVEEELVVGKRQVSRGGVRIYSHLVETPVSEQVSLRDEQVFVDRRPVSRAATEADFTTGAGVIELNATGEEAVVGKSSRVVEEVVVGKQSSERTEQITDTVRHTEVDVEPVTTTTATTTSTKDLTKDRY